MLLDVSAKVPPPYMPPAVAGFVTVTVAVPAVAMAEAGMLVVSWAPLTAVVVCAVPFQLMVALPAKLAPLTVSTKAGPPEFALSGTSSVMLGIVPTAGGVVAFEL
jgi:hypothetical protein